ncbi:MAG: HigA family addiction module antidote protein [Betaproteobacteria bacterium]|nr:HigA family addiction module antidote protein [Betaproteobacteria bacterium]
MGMHNPPHPGEILKEMWIKPLSLTVTRAAAELKVSRKTLSEILNGRAAVTTEMAVRLELAFGKSAESWLGHQAAHDLWAIQSRKASMGIQRINGNTGS